jgi:predicted membrane protein
MGYRHHHARSGVVGGVALLAIGAILLLQQNGVINFSDVWRLWPLALVIGGLVRMTQYGARSRVMGAVLILLGGILEAAEFNLIPYTIWELWPLGIIAIGLVLLWQSLQPRVERDVPFAKVEFHARGIDNFAIFGAGQRRISDADFSHFEVLALFGGYNLDLRKAVMKGSSAIVDATAIFGGIEIIVPEHWNVVVRGVGIFGGYGDESHHPPASEPAPELVVQGVAIFGGVAIKN